MIRGDHVRKALTKAAVDPKATADERHRLGYVTYYLTTRTYADIAKTLNEMASDPDDPPLMVPRNPTDDMVQAGLYQFKLGGDEWATVYQIWTDMFTALTMDGGCIDSLPAAPTAPLDPKIRGVLESARDRIKDMLMGDDGQAWKEAEKALPAIEAALAEPVQKMHKLIDPEEPYPTPLGLEWTEDGLSLRTPYDGDVDGDTGQHVVVGGETVITFADSDIAEEYRERILAALDAPLLTKWGERAIGTWHPGDET